MSRLTKKNSNGYDLVEKGEVYYVWWNEMTEKTVRKLGKFEDLEEELGCPLEVAFKVLKDEKILFKNEEYYGSLRWNNYINEFVFDLSNDKEETDFYLRTNDYGKTWWLKGEK